jgi:hypothetical protein
MSSVRQIACAVIALLAVFLGTPASAQNLDAGKSPAQIFADTCSACHRRPQELKRASAAFLRGHYTTGQQEAATMANYLASIPADPRATQQKRQPPSGSAPAETRRQEQPKEQAKSPPAAASKSRRNGRAEAKAPAAAVPTPEVTPPEPPAPPAAAPPPPLEPFEE